MFVLIDGQALQDDSPPGRRRGRRVRRLLTALAALRPGWRWEVVQNAALPPIADPPPGWPVRSFHPRLGSEPDRTAANALFLGDWLAALRPDAVLLLGPAAAPALSPRFTRPRPRIVPIDCRRAVGPSTIVATLEEGEPHAGGCRSRRKRLAWLSPLPPTPSGISDYSVELLAPLRERYDIDLVLDPAQPPLPPDLVRRHVVYPAAELAARHAARPYDQFVNHVGNSRYHVFQLDALERYGGLVVLHDYFIGGLVIESIQARTGRPATPEDLAGELDRQGEPEVAARLRGGRIGLWQVPDEAPLNRGVLGRAEAVVVHSRWALERVRRRTAAPVSFVPPPMETPRLGTRDEERRRLGLPPGDFILCTLGVVGAAKRVSSLLRAAALLAKEVREGLLLLVVGPGDAHHLRELDDLAGRLGLRDRVRFAGRVPLEEFTAYARAADVCVQLRYPTRGETSAALLRELAAGAACVITDHGSIAEVPDDVVLKVRPGDAEVADLTAALSRLYRDPALRIELGTRAARHVAARHDLPGAAARYAAAIELSIARREADDRLWRDRVGETLVGCDPAVAVALLAEWTALRAQALTERGQVQEGMAGGLAPLDFLASRDRQGAA